MIKVEKYLLPNGLRVLHHYDSNTRMTAINILYDVGSKDESPQRTGFAHLFEHLMFGGSVNIPDFDTPLQHAGGDNNAWTSNDITNYYTIVPTHNAETAFWIESDRMLGLAFSEQNLSIQKHVVIEEFKQRTLNQPYGDIYQLLRPLVYTVHPYRWPVIGKEIRDIEEASLDEVKEFYYTHYAPNNAIMCISGSLALQDALALSEKWFAPIAARSIAPRILPIEPPQKEPHILHVERNVPLDAIIKAYHMCGRKDNDYQAYDILSDILGTGASSRLYKELVQNRRLFNSIDASISGDIEPGMFIINGKLNKGISFEEGEQAITDELEKLRQEYIGEREITKAVNCFETEYFVSNMNYADKAANLAYYELLGDANNINTETNKYRNLTSEKLRQCSRNIFTSSNCSTIYYHSKSK